MLFGEVDLKRLFILWMSFVVESWAGRMLRSTLFALPDYAHSTTVQMCLITATLAVLTEASACSAFKSHQINMKFLVRRPHFYIACACIPAYALHVHDRIYKVASFKKSHQR